MVIIHVHGIRWIFDKLGQRCEQDAHPDAHALRLKLSLMVAYSDNKPKWEVRHLQYTPWHVFVCVCMCALISRQLARVFCCDGLLLWASFFIFHFAGVN